jgi:hypothetical protein
MPAAGDREAHFLELNHPQHAYVQQHTKLRFVEFV